MREIALLSVMFVIGGVNAETLGDLIDREKLSRQLDNKDKPTHAPIKGAAAKSPKRLDAKAPLLWSLTGLDEQLQAILIYEQKAYIVRYGDWNSIKVGPWSVIKINYLGLELTTPKGKGYDVIELRALPPGTSARRYIESLTRHLNGSANEMAAPIDFLPLAKPLAVTPTHGQDISNTGSETNPATEQ